ncbi:cell filamentation protein Fic [Clostridium botulinum]|uniref:Fic family protein n=1 Tax=Clostridium botulinum TaxID=1491 RepID=UPI0009475A0B|nr:Fic family protein [Clostridium botulinum]APQ77020.1 fic/DOC family protein [Clostridium botulinum]AUM98413.1 cell filamentation protein Fic [Clostridium botulinum]MBN3347061.1 cell filamentation protein Fic [Clostridium botulinum]MBN3352783.1 cell filamentation protein Fic [Clostridium botulinum]OPD21639.1 cell filamentation protein Fic [Clostridium botulinum]
MDKFIENIKTAKDIKNSIYYKLRHEFLYHSNKIEGSTFTTESLALLLDKNVVEGKHTLDDVQETVNSSYVFDYIIDTIDEKVDMRYIKYLHSMLKNNTTDYERGFSGVFKKIPNTILGTDVQLAQPYEVEYKLEELISWYYQNKIVNLDIIAEFHFRFEMIHPFQDGNGRIGRFLMLKQLLENNLPLSIISWDTEDLYRKALAKCSTGNYAPLVEYLKSFNDFKEVNKALWEF